MAGFISDGRLYLSSTNGDTFEHIPFGGTIISASTERYGDEAYSAIIIDLNNNLWVIGINERGSLGLGNVEQVETFTPILPNVKFQTAQLGYCTMAIDFDGNLWFTGKLTSRTSALEFTQLTEDINFVDVSCKYGKCLAVDSYGNLYGCGYNGWSLLGIRNEDTSQFRMIKENAEFKKVDIPYHYYCLFVETNGDVWGTFANALKDLGVNGEEGEFIKISEGLGIKSAAGAEKHILLLSEDGKVFSLRLNTDGTVPEEELRVYKEIAQDIDQIYVDRIFVGEGHDGEYIDRFTLLDRNGGIWVLDSENPEITIERRVQNMTGESLTNQSIVRQSRRYATTKSAANYSRFA